MHTSHLIPVLDTSIEMKTFLILLVLGYASSDKLDLTYLPPPGSQFAGGRPEDIQVPLEFPKETPSTTFRPEFGDNRGLSPESYRPTIGIDRVPGPQNIDIVSPGSQTLPNQRVPTTTVSYAFTQTTTHPPNEGFETTISPQVTGGYPTTDVFNNYPSQEPGLDYQGNNAQIRPGYQQPVNQYGQRPTLAPTSGPTYDIVSSQQPSLDYQENLNQNLPGSTGTVNQFGQPTSIPTAGPDTQFTGPFTTEQQFAQNYPSSQQGSQFQPGQNQQIIPGSTHGFSTGPQFINQSFSGYPGNGNRPGVVPTTSAPQGFSTTTQPGSTIENGNTGGLPGSYTTAPQGSYPGQQIPVTNYQQGSNFGPNQITSGQQNYDDRQITNQRFPGSQQTLPSSTVAPIFAPGFPEQQLPGTSVGPNFNNKGVLPGRQQYPGFQQFVGSPADNRNVFQPSSTAAPNFPNQQFSSGTVSPGLREQFPTSSIADYSTPRYPGTQADAVSTIFKNRPERPQAESDRNAVILNYKNEITPEGFAYSFDTSNGIHADENGTAIDGVKAEGSFSYTGDDGKVYSIVYTADENGYRPRGDHLPTAPPVPEAIQRVIEQAEKDKAAGITHDGSYDEDKYGHKKYHRRNKPANKASSTATVVSEDDLSEIAEQDASQRLRPQGQKKPMISTEREQYKGDYSESGPVTDGQNTNDFNGRKPGQYSTQRPINRVTDREQGITDEEVVYENEGTTGRPFDSRRPISQSGKKQYNNMYIPGADSNIRNENRRRPINKVASTQEVNRDRVTEYGPEDEEDVGKGSFVSKSPTRRPMNDDEIDEYENEEDSAATEKYENEKTSSRPLLSTRKPFRRLGSNTPTENEETVSQQSFDKYGRPLQEKSKIYNKQRIGSKRPSKPQSIEADEPQTVTEDYDSDEDYVTSIPSKQLSGKISTKFNTRDRTAPNRMKQRPTYVSKVSTNKNNAYLPGQSDDDIKLGTDVYNKRPITQTDGSSNDDKYAESNPNSDDLDATERDYTSGPEESSTVYSGTTGRPQISYNSRNDYRIQETGDKGKNVLKPGTKFGQKITRPGSNQNTDTNESDVYENRPTDESGYQYVPPQRPFYHDEVKVIPNQFKGTTRRPVAGRPTANDYYGNKNAPSKPFMTPNVAHSSEKHAEDYNRGVYSGTPGVTIDNEQDNQFDENSADGTTPGQGYDDDEHTKLSNQFPTRRPTYQQSTGRPKYTQNVPSFTNQGIRQKGRPAQGSNIPYYESTQTPQGIISSTTPMPSIGQEASSGPGQVSISSTTPYYNGDNQHQTTYRPSVTIQPTTGYENRTFGQRLPTIGSNTANITPDVYKNRYQGSQPTTTYRPNLMRGQSQPSSTTRPSVVVDRYGRPINKPGSNAAPAYEPGSQVPSTTGPEGTVDVYGRPIPGFDTTAQDYATGDQNVPSSTAAPGVFVDAFGRPVDRPGSGTTVQEFVPASGNEVSSTIRPASIDAYGRPVATPGLREPSSTATPEGFVDAFGRPVQPGSIPQGYRPGVQQPSTTRPGVTFDVYGRPVTTGVSPSEYTPVYSTPSGNGLRQPGTQFTGSQSTTPLPGSQFGGNRFQTSSMRPGLAQGTFSTFRPTTERIKGEDFSGPKQQQKFDPEHGYYY